MAARSSRATGGSGAEPWADWIRPRSNLSSASLCMAVSTERATTCTPPARLAVGAASRVTNEGSTLHSAATAATTAGGRRLAGLEHADDRVFRLAEPDRVVDRLSPPDRAHRTGAHGEVLPLADCPAGVLAGQAGLHRMIGHDLNHRHRPPRDVSRYDRHQGEVTQADQGQLDAQQQPPRRVDPAVDVPVLLPRSDAGPLFAPAREPGSPRPTRGRDGSRTSSSYRPPACVLSLTRHAVRPGSRPGRPPPCHHCTGQGMPWNTA